jgi:hypothetical protein
MLQVLWDWVWGEARILLSLAAAVHGIVGLVLCSRLLLWQL